MTDFAKLQAIDAPLRAHFDQLLASGVKELLTPAEIKAQRLSWVMGMLPHDTLMSRDEVRELLARHYG